MNKPEWLDGKQVNRGSAEVVYEAVRRKIISLAYPPGTDLDEKMLVESLGVSRTPVREALIRLATEGLVETKRNRGASVAPLDLETLQSIFEAGDLIEKAIMRLACMRRREEHLAEIETRMLVFEKDMARKDIAAMVDSNSHFHQAIARAAGNKYFIDCYRRVLADHERIAQIWYTHNLDADKGSANALILEQHRDIVQALRERDAARGEELSKAHADLCKDGVRAILSAGGSMLSDLSVETVEL